jgi:hypothetical protein
MNGINKLCFALIRCLIVLSVGCVSPRITLADSISRTFSFTGSGFPPEAPVDPVFGNLTVSFDTTVTTFGSVDSFTSNLDVVRPVSYIFRPLQNFGELAIGTSCSLGGGCSAGSGTNDLLLDIFGAATSTPSFSVFAYSTTSGGVFEAPTTTLSFVETVPEPSSLLMLCVGVLGLALFSLRELSDAKYRRIHAS